MPDRSEDNSQLPPKFTRLLGPKDVFSDTEFGEVVSPVVEPAEDKDWSLINDYLADLGFSGLRPSSTQKLGVLLSSFLMQSMRLEGRRERHGEAMLIGWPHDESYWRRRSKVGYRLAEQLREAMIEHGWITHAKGATVNLHEGNGNCHGYMVADFVPPMGRELSVQSTEMMYAISTSSKKSKLENDVVDDRVRAIWAKWKESPLEFSGQRMFTAARRFNNDDLTRGGRFYGVWTTMKKVDRLECVIGNHPVAEVDVSGMNLTVLASISGEVPFKTRFKDPYECGWDDRNQVKAIINETIGAGTPRHYQMGRLARDAGLDQPMFTHIRREFITPKFKCLQSLKKGELDSLTLAFHESEIMMRVVEKLKTPCFILHDCLICIQSEALDVGKAMQETYIDYCKEQGWRPIAPAFTIERAGFEPYEVSGSKV